MCLLITQYIEVMCFTHMYMKSFEQYGDKSTEYKFCDGGKVIIFDNNTESN